MKQVAEQDVEPWKQRFRAPQVLTSAIAWASPTRGIAATNLSALYQLYCWDVPSGRLTPLTSRPEGIVQGAISPDGRFVYYFDDAQGQEIGHYVRVPYAAAAGAAPEDITPDVPLYSPPSSPEGLAISRAGNRLAFIGVDRDGFHLYAMGARPDGTLDAPRVIFTSTSDTLGPAITADGAIGVVASDDRTGMGHFSLRAFDLTDGRAVAELWDGEASSLQLIACSPIAGDARLLAITNRTSNDTLLIWDPVSGQRTDLIRPELDGATRAFGWSPDGTRIVLRTFKQAVQHFYVYDLAAERLSAIHPLSGTYRNAYFATNDEIFVHRGDSTHPIQLVALDAATGALRRTVLAAGEVPPGHPWRSITFPSSDGQPIQGWLALPDGAGPFPTILETHGGPYTVETDNFSPASQAWLDHGFAYLTINYRGSTTFGRAFQEQINGHPGQWEVEDLAAARAWLVAQRVADPARVLLTGWSYGGYLTLLALGRKPDLWAGGMAGSALADWRIAYEHTTETLRAGIISFFGGTPDDRPDAYAASSPLSYVERVTAPVLIVQGRNDTRTPARPVEEYAERMAALGKPIEVLWYETGHLGPLLQTEESIRHQEVMLAFAQRIAHARTTFSQRPATRLARWGALGRLFRLR